jgi:hypothetical protein
MKKPVIFLSIAFVACIIGIGAYILIPGSTTEIEKAADSFETGENWDLTMRRVEPAYRLCLGGNQCPSVRKDWQTDQKVTLTDFQSMISESGWNLMPKGSCEPKQNVAGEGPVCSASGRVNDFNVQIYLSKDKSSPISKLQLFVDPAK